MATENQESLVRPGTEPARSHIPVLLSEVVQHLKVREGQRYIDATVGAGGHSQAILDAADTNARLLCLDADPIALRMARRRFKKQAERVVLVESNFRSMRDVALRHGFGEVQGILMDLGVSSMQLDSANRGFAFQSEGPLDMRLSPSAGQTAADLVNRLPESDLADILWKYGEERASRRIAGAIVRHRPLHTTKELAEVIGQVMPRKGKVHPATRSFQALRIAVNDELNALMEALPQAVELLTPGGRLVVISFHSLEDRIVKRFFQRETRDCICPPELPVCQCDHRATLNIVTPKPVRPASSEVRENPRSRSARLRAAERR